MTDEKSERGGLWEDLSSDFAKVWNSIPLKWLFFALLGVWVVLFHFLGNSTFGYIKSHSLLEWMYWAYNTNEDDQHGLYIPLVILVLFWISRNDFRGTVTRPWFGGLLFVFLGLGLHLLGYVGQQARISIAGFFLGIYGILGLTWGPDALRKSFFPMCLLAFAIPLGTLAESITFPLRLLATHLTTFFASHVLGINVIQRGTQLMDPNGAFQYEVAAACGGLRSLTAVLALCTIFAFLNFTKIPRRILMIAAAFPLAVLGNVSRLLLIVTVSEAFGQKTGQLVHDNSYLSLIPYIPPIIGIVVLGHFLQEDRPEQITQPEPVQQPA